MGVKYIETFYLSIQYKPISSTTKIELNWRYITDIKKLKQYKHSSGFFF